MSKAIGQALAFLKIGVLALVIMLAIWGITKVIETRGRQKPGGRDGPDAV